MKKFFNYAATLAIMAVCAFGISACGSDDDDIKPVSMFGDWVSIVQRTDGTVVFENDNFNGNNVIATCYYVYGNNVINLQTATWNVNNITNIEKKYVYGTFSYTGSNLSMTFADGTVSGPISFRDNGSTAIWKTQSTSLEMVRPTTAIISLQTNIESLYQRYFAGK